MSRKVCWRAKPWTFGKRRAPSESALQARPPAPEFDLGLRPHHEQIRVFMCLFLSVLDRLDGALPVFQAVVALGEVDEDGVVVLAVGDGVLEGGDGGGVVAAFEEQEAAQGVVGLEVDVRGVEVDL